MSAVVLCSCCAAWPATGIAAGRPAPVTTVAVVEDQGVVGPQQIAGFSQRCPARAPHPVGGTFGSADTSPRAGQLLLTASYPLKRAGWRVDVQNITPTPQPFFAGAVCVGSSERIAYAEATDVAAPGMDDGFTMRCPRRAPQPIGGFFAPQAAAGLGQVAGDGAYPVKTGWDVGVRNLGPSPQPYYAGAVCAGAALRVGLVSRTGRIAAGKRAGTRLTCPRRTPQPLTSVFAAGNASARGQILATEAFRTGARTWYTGVRNVSERPQVAATGVVCVR